MKPLPSIQRIREIFQYDHETGLITRTVTVSPNGQKGWIAGTPCGNGYLSVRVDNTRIKAHRLAWAMFHGEWPTRQIDHINGEKSDNRISNLRDVTASENKQNLRSGRAGRKAGKLLGTSYCKRDKTWSSRIELNGNRIHLGTFTTEEEAHFAYLIKKREIHVTCTI